MKKSELKKLIEQAIEEALPLYDEQESYEDEWEKLADQYSDIYKEKLGGRPRELDIRKHKAKDIQKMIDDLYEF